VTEPTSDRTAGGAVADSDAVRDALIGAVIDFLSGQDLLTQQDIRTALAHEIACAGRGALLDLRERLRMDAGWGYYPPDPLARRIHHVLADRFLRADSLVTGTAHLNHVAVAPSAVIVANHVSYADANVIEVLLQRTCGAAVAGRLTALAGPKIFSDRRRRFSSLCFGTIKVPQSADVSSEEAVLTARDVARAARQSIDAAFARLAAGDLLVLFGEGTRSRTAEMQRMLPGTARYLARPNAIVVPVGIAGAEHLFPIGDPTIHPARVVMAVGRPLAAETLFARAAGDRRVVVDAIGLAVADVLPAEYRGVYRDRGLFADASKVLEDCR
jgi:1-acyl-sn-glycerol-3-phosphate acyltransferase